jgi:Fic family protein
MFEPCRPYNELPALPPATDVETKAILKRCIRARTALAELRLAAQLIPNPAVLISTIPTLEAKDSSEIENVVATTHALFREASVAEEGGNPAVKEALRCRTALYQGVRAVKDSALSTRIAVEICRTIKNIQLDIRKTTGTILKNSFTGEVIYTPPDGEARLRGLLANWEQFLSDPIDLDPLIKMAILHYQFEAIHPFTDGNGRTGRILNILCLVQDKLLDLPVLYLSRHILRTKANYYRLLARVTTHQEWEPWILYMLEAIEVTANWTNQRIRAIRQLMDETTGLIRKLGPKTYARDLIDLIFAQPYARIGSLVERGIAKRQAASSYLKELVALGILEEEKIGRDKVFLHKKYLALLASDEHEFEPYQSVAGTLAAR